MKAFIEEVFGSIQGEGPWVGLPQYFLRFSGCNLKCTYCDTPARFSKRPELKFEAQPGSQQFEFFQNPVPMHHIVELIGQLKKNFKAQSLALTGGEPLLFVPMLKEILPILRGAGLKIYLETNGICPNELNQIKEHIDFVSMDYKLEAYLQGDKAEALHAEFIEILKKDFQGCFYIKVVFDSEKPEDILAVEKIQKRLIDSNIALSQIVLQPIVWDKFPAALRIDPRLTARVIPQTHKMLAVL